MIKAYMFDAKPYDKIYFEKYKTDDIKIEYIESKLNSRTAVITSNYDVVIAFVNDKIDKDTIDILYKNGIKLLALRCAGFNNVDFKNAFEKIHIARVPEYSPYAVAEHSIALLLTLNRKTHKAFNRVREYNFSLNGLTGFDIKGKTIGVIGTGKIGQCFINICKGFGAKILAYDPYPIKNLEVNYVDLEQLYKQSDVISLHCPLTKDTQYIIKKDTIKLMKKDVIIINTSRGALIESEDLLQALKEERIGGACLDVYEEESDFFYEDRSMTILKDDILARLISMPNVIITSHQAFLTKEALQNIAKTTIKNIKDFANGKPLENEICYHCKKYGKCKEQGKGKCF